MLSKTRIDLGEGDYAIVYNEMIHRTNRLLQQALFLALGTENYQALQIQLRNASSDAEKRDILRNLPIEREDEIVLLNQTLEWSFGLVDQATLDCIPSRKYDQLAQEVDKLYSQIPLAVKT